MKATSVGGFAVMNYAQDGVHGVQVAIQQRRGYTHDAQSITLMDTLYGAVYNYFQWLYDTRRKGRSQ